MTPGKVYLVGAGPGDPGLLTVRAKALVQQAEVIVYDNLVNTEMLELASADCELIYVGKQPGSHAVSQDEIEDLLNDRAVKGKMVVRLKGGDPFVFGRGGEEARRLAKDGISFEIVPGVTAALAAAAYAGIPLTHRDFSSAVCFLTGHENPDKHEMRVRFREFAQTGGTLCIYMGMGHIDHIADELMAGGADPSTPVAVIQWATLPGQECLRTTLESVAEEVKQTGMGPPAVIVAGEAVTYSRDIAWFENRPLFGKRVVVTRSKRQAGELSQKLRDAGAEVLELPLISVEPHVDEETAKDVFAEIGQYEWLVFTSANGVRFFFDEFYRKFEDLRSIGFLRVAVIGKATAQAVKDERLKVDLMPKDAVAESLAKELAEHQSLDNVKVLVVTGNLNRDVLVTKLEEARAIVDIFPVYKTVKTDLSKHPAAERFREEGADVVTFTSSSTVKSFTAQAKALQLGPDARQPIACSIGPITSETMRKAGMPVDIEASEQSLDGVVGALIKYVQTSGK